MLLSFVDELSLACLPRPASLIIGVRVVDLGSPSFVDSAALQFKLEGGLYSKNQYIRAPLDLYAVFFPTLTGAISFLSASLRNAA